MIRTSSPMECVEFCKALADDTRQRILAMLMEREMPVGDIVAAFAVSQPTISPHPNVLKQMDLVIARRDGKQILYSTNRERVVACCGMLVAKLDARSCET